LASDQRPELCEVIITAPDAEWLASFTRRLVADRLAAGAHEITTIRSIYRWRDEVHDHPEARVTLHTRTEHVPAIASRADAEHPYEVPCVMAIPIQAGGAAYLEWIISQTDPAATG
jgi:periplasmic divalent cation tolerance protein